MFFFKRKPKQSLTEEKFKKLAKEHLRKVLLTGRCSPQDEHNILHAARVSGYEFEIDRLFYVQKSLWLNDQKESFKLPELSVEMDDGRICYHTCPCFWRIRDSAPTDYYRGHSYEGVDSSHESNGNLFITDKTIIFLGTPEVLRLNMYI